MKAVQLALGGLVAFVLVGCGGREGESASEGPSNAPPGVSAVTPPSAEPVVPPPAAPNDASPPATLAPIEAKWLTVRGGFVYALTSNEVWRVATKGGAPQLLGRASGTAILSRLVVDDSFVYVSDGSDAQGQVLRVPLSGGALERFWDVGAGRPVSGIALAEGAVLVTLMAGGGGLWRFDPAAGAAAKLTDTFSASVVVDGAFAYTGSTGGTLVRTERATGASQELAFVDAAIDDMIVDGESLYLAVNEGAEAGAILRVPVGGGTITRLADEERPSALAVGGDYVYWATEGARVDDQFGDGGRVRRTLRAGGPVEDVASNLPSPSSIAVDADGVYLASIKRGAVLRVPLP